MGLSSKATVSQSKSIARVVAPPDEQIFQPTARNLVLTGRTPVVGGLNLRPSAGSLALTGRVPVIGGINARPTAGSLVLTGKVPILPLKITGLTFWYDASMITGLSNNDPVTTWADVSGNGNDATGSGATRPLYKTNIFGSLPGVLFASASSTEMTIPNCLTGAGGMAFVVAKQIADPPSSGGAILGGMVAGGSGGFGNSGSGCHEPFTDGVIYECYGTTVRKTVGNPTPSHTNAHIYSIVSAASDFRFYFDGTEIFSTATNTVGWNTQPRLGTSNTAAYYDGYAACVIQFGVALDTTTRRTVESYLGNRWGITVA